MVLEVKNLKKTFVTNGVSNTACKGISFHIEENECFGLIGESGCGKSTVANMIAGLIQPDEGTISFEGKALEGSRRDRRLGRKNMQMIFQNPQASFNPRMKLGRAIIEPLLLSEKKYSRAKTDALLDETMASVGLKAEYKNKYHWEISGGECQRAAIARAMIAGPSFLICDEITSALDVSIQAQILHLINEQKEKSEISFLFISHDLAVVSNICDKVAVMFQGRIVEFGETKKIVKNPGHPYTRNLIRSALRPGETDLSKVNKGDPEEKGCPYYPYCSKAIGLCQIRVNEVDMSASHSTACIVE